MHITLDISQNLKDGFQPYLNMIEENGEFKVDPKVGGGQGMEFITLPGNIEFYHFKKSYFNNPIYLKSINSINSKHFLIHINLSKVKQEKIVEDQVINLHKYLPIGLLMYGPGLEIETYLPPNVEMELASIRFHHSFLDQYFEDWHEFIDTNKNLISEELDFELESILLKALNAIKNKMDCHILVLKFLRLFFERIKKHSRSEKSIKLHSDDLKKLFEAAAHLRNPTETSVPSIEDLAQISNMSITKFKSSFKQLFGSPPFQYRNKIRMNYAREMIVSKKKTPSEMSHILGYTHPSNFTAAFKKYFGELPSDHL